MICYFYFKTPDDEYGPRISSQSANEGGKVVSLTHQPPLPPGDIMPMKNSNDIIWNRTPDLPGL